MTQSPEFLNGETGGPDEPDHPAGRIIGRPTVSRVPFFLIYLVLVPVLCIILLYINEPAPAVAVAASLLVVSGIRRARKARFRIGLRPEHAVRAVEAGAGERFDRLLLRFPPFLRLHAFFLRWYTRDIPASGKAVAPKAVATRIIRWFALTLISSIAVSLALFHFTGMIFAFLFLGLPPGVFFIRMTSLRGSAKQRASKIEGELFFFVTFCDIMEQMGRGLNGALEMVQKEAASLFPAARTESLIISREMDVFYKSLDGVLRNVAAIHPSVPFREYINGYLTSQSAGGRGPVEYIHERLREYAVTTKQKMEAYGSKTEMLATVGSFGLVMFPIFIVIGGIFLDPQTLFFLGIFGVLFTPIIIVMLIQAVLSMSPVPPVRLKVPRYPIYAAAGAGLACFILGREPWEIAIYPLMVWSVYNFILCKDSLLSRRKLERSLPVFIRDINQRIRSKPSFFVAFMEIERLAPYTPEFNDTLREIKRKTVLGKGISRALMESRTGSWLADSILMLLAFAARSGHVTESVLERLAQFCSHYLESRATMSEKTMTALMTGYMGSIIVVMMILMIPIMSFEQFAALDELVDADLTPTFDMSGAVGDVNLVLVVVGAFSSMSLVCTIRYSTMLFSLHPAILLAAIAGLLYYDRYVGISL